MVLTLYLYNQKFDFFFPYYRELQHARGISSTICFLQHEILWFVSRGSRDNIDNNKKETNKKLLLHAEMIYRLFHSASPLY